MCFKPVDFSFLDCPIGKSYRGSAFPLTPATFTVRAVQIASNVYSPACGDCFNVFDLAEDLEFHHTLSLLRYPFDSGETANTSAHRELPTRSLSAFSHPSQGSGAVAQTVRGFLTTGDDFIHLEPVDQVTGSLSPHS